MSVATVGPTGRWVYVVTAQACGNEDAPIPACGLMAVDTATGRVRYHPLPNSADLANVEDPILHAPVVIRDGDRAERVYVATIPDEKEPKTAYLAAFDNPLTNPETNDVLTKLWEAKGIYGQPVPDGAMPVASDSPKALFVPKLLAEDSGDFWVATAIDWHSGENADRPLVKIGDRAELTPLTVRIVVADGVGNYLDTENVLLGALIPNPDAGPREVSVRAGVPIQRWTPGESNSEFTWGKNRRVTLHAADHGALFIMSDKGEVWDLILSSKSDANTACIWAPGRFLLVPDEVQGIEAVFTSLDSIGWPEGERLPQGIKSTSGNRMYDTNCQ